MRRSHVIISLCLLGCGTEPRPAAPQSVPEAPKAAAAVSASCIPPGGPLDTALAAKQVGCPCDPKFQRDSCVDGLALTCEEGRWSSIPDGPCGEHAADSPAACIAASAQGSADAQSCACSGQVCYVRDGKAHVCSANRWFEVQVADCWQRIKAR